ncbi:MAG: M48 family metallopeptidase [Thermoplasmata archaeon]
MGVQIDQVRYTRRKNIMLKIDRDGRLIVLAPLHTGKREIQEAVNRHRKWIEKTRERVLARKSAENRVYEEGTKLYYGGMEYPLIVVEGVDEPLKFENGFLLRKDMLPCAKEVLREWYLCEAKMKLPVIAKQIAKMHGLKFKKVRVTRAERRWGSCSDENNISLSYRLIMLPQSAMEYVIIHELAHLKEKNHSKKFWALVEKMMPDYKIHRKWIREHSHILRI